MELMFRVWDKITKTMTYPLSGDGDSLYLSLEGQVCSFDDRLDKELQYRGYRLKPLLYTNKQDKNGRFIYDGDILSAVKFDTDIVVGSSRTVYYKQDRSMFYWGNEYTHEPFYNFGLGVSQYVVIGNIYENEELGIDN